MRWATATLSCSVLLLAACGPGALHLTPVEKPMKDSPDPAQIEAAYRLEFNVPAARPDAQVTLLPGASPLPIEARLARQGDPPPLVETRRSVALEATAGGVSRAESAEDWTRWLWTPPDASRLATLTIRGEAALETEPGASTPLIISKQAIVRFLTPLSSSRLVNGVIDGYRMGSYPDPLKSKGDEGPWIRQNASRYRLPESFYRVDAADKPLRISPHLTLGHFVIDFPWGSLGMPQYITIDMNLVEKLEELIELMHRDGHRFTTLTPIYGFRCPDFNQESIQGRPESNLKVTYSMHQYGRALDFIIDEDGDLIMDDLNGDGRIDMHDSAVIMHYVNILDRRYREEGNGDKLGGAGLYAHHDFIGRPQTPYIHVDTRGFLTGSGTLVRWPDTWPDGSRIQFGKL